MECGYKGLVFCRNNGWIMENMDKGLTVTKWVLIVQQKIHQKSSPKPKSSGFQWKKASLGVRSPWQNCFRQLSFWRSEKRFHNLAPAYFHEKLLPLRYELRLGMLFDMKVIKFKTAISLFHSCIWFKNLEWESGSGPPKFRRHPASYSPV